MHIEGTLLDIMESWPLQLTVDTAAGRRHVVLTMTTTLHDGGEEAPVHHLRPGQRLRLHGEDTNGAFRAHHIEVIEGTPGT